MSAFRRADGFRPYTFVVWAEPPEAWKAKNWVTCSFRFEAWACWTHIEVQGTPRSAWHRRVSAGLVRAGYECWLRFDDSTAFRRLLPNSRSRESEIAFLETLVAHGDETQWPKRRIIPYRERKTPPKEWLAPIAAIRNSAVAWTDACIGFTRRTPLVIAGTPTGFDVVVSVLAMHDDWSFRVSVRFFDPGNRDSLLPTPLRRRLRRELTTSGYEFRTFKRGKKRLHGQLNAERKEKSARRAAVECSRIFERIGSLGISVGRSTGVQRK